MVSLESVTTALYKAAFIAGATAGGGPAGGATAASFVNSAAGEAAVAKAVSVTLGENNVDSGNFAMGGLVMSPTLAMIGEAGPEMVVPLVKPKKKRSRSARAADKKLSRAFKEANARYRLKSGALRKGRTQTDIAKLAHKLRKKM
tara:strand:+ start:664 stop:1098 length:435 start_codon:yes stop_codon:yes gene_type:complete